MRAVPSPSTVVPASATMSSGREVRDHRSRRHSCLPSRPFSLATSTPHPSVTPAATAVDVVGASSADDVVVCRHPLLGLTSEGDCELHTAALAVLDANLAISQRFWYRCRKCGTTVTYEDSEADHIEPVNRFANFEQANTPTNLQILCLDCHREKTAEDR